MIAVSENSANFFSRKRTRSGIVLRMNEIHRRTIGLFFLYDFTRFLMSYVLLPRRRYSSLEKVSAPLEKRIDLARFCRQQQQRRRRQPPTTITHGPFFFPSSNPPPRYPFILIVNWFTAPTRAIRTDTLWKFCHTRIMIRVCKSSATIRILRPIRLAIYLRLCVS